MPLSANPIQTQNNVWFSVSMGLLGVILGYGIAVANLITLPGSTQIADRPSAPSNVPPAPEPPPPAAGPVAHVDPQKDYIRGSPNAKVTVVEYSDYECPFCKKHHPNMLQLMADYKDDVNFVFRHYPLSFHPNAQKEAEAAECIGALGGNDAFWKYTDAIFERTQAGGKGFALDKLPALAKELGVNETSFKDCLDSGKFAQKVKDEASTGVAAGVQGTPGTILINNRTKEEKLIEGAVPLASFKSSIDAMLAKS